MDALSQRPAVPDLLLRARELVSAGDAEAATTLATAVLDDALEAGDFRLQGEAMHCLAVAELRLLGRFDRALELAERATLCFQRCGDEPGECAALATHVIACVKLGRNERAMESALLSVRLAEHFVDPRSRVQAYHALGIAAYSGRNFDESRNAFQRAIQEARRCEPPLNEFELLVDLASTECLLFFTERNLGGTLPSLDAAARHVAECKRLLALCADDRTDYISLSPGSHVNNLLVLSMSALFLRIWTGDIVGARKMLGDYRDTACRNERPWTQATEYWGEAEIALLEGKLEYACACAERMISIAEVHGHETLTGIGYQLLSHACERRGDFVGALNAMKRLVRREQAARAESLKSRVSVIEWQIELRENREQVERLTTSARLFERLAQEQLREKREEVERLSTSSRLFEKLAMEDALTGLANRRALETALTAMLDALNDGHGQPLCIALIDVDRFKQINDRYSHHAGDEALKAVAQAFRKNVREGDFCARLGGDEFVLVLRASLADAENICRRIESDIADWDGGALAPGLRVTVSIGLAGAESGDTVASLLDRGDQRMYSLKATRA